MTDIRRVSLFSKLNPMLYKALETATAFAKLRGNAYVELVHWLHQLLKLQDNDVLRIVKRAGLNLDAVEQDLVRALDRLPHGATSISDISEHVDNAVERAWVYASLRFEATSIRGAYLLAGIVKTPGLRQVLDWVRQYVGIEFAWELRLVLKKQEARGMQLGSDHRLGWGSWLGTRLSDTDAGDMVFQPEALFSRSASAASVAAEVSSMAL